MTGCSVAGCRSRCENGIQLFQLPNGQSEGSQARRLIWLKNIQRTDTPHKLRICVLHFNESDIGFDEHRDKFYIKKNAIPVKNLPQTKTVRKEPPVNVKYIDFGQSIDGTDDIKVCTDDTCPDADLLLPMISFQFNQTEESEDETKFIPEIETKKIFDVKSPINPSETVKSVYAVVGPTISQRELKDDGSIHKPLHRIVPNTHGHVKRLIIAPPPKPMNVDGVEDELNSSRITTEIKSREEILEERLRIMEFKYLGALKQINRLGSDVKVLQKQVQILFKGREAKTPYEKFYYNKD